MQKDSKLSTLIYSYNTMYFSNLTLSPTCSLEFVDNKNEEHIPITPFRYDKRSKVHKFVV